MTMEKYRITYSIFWNCGLIVIGCLIQAIALKAIAIPHGFVPGGLFGVSSLIYYKSGVLNPAQLYLLLNIPMFIAGYLLISRRFLLYSGLAMLLLTMFYELISFQLQIQNQFYAALVFGAMLGSGAGIVLRSLGSNGGLVIAPIIGVFVTSVAVDYLLSMFNQRKLTFIISDGPDEIAEQIMDTLKIGTTILPALGSYRKQEKSVLMVVINNIQLKRLEEIVFTVDQHALFIVENTFSVLGSTFSKRKIY